MVENTTSKQLTDLDELGKSHACTDSAEESSLMATSELKQILGAPADAVLVGDTNVMELEEVASALGISVTTE